MARPHRMPLYTLSFCIRPVGDSHFSLIFQHLSSLHLVVSFYIFISNRLFYMPFFIFFYAYVYIYVWDGTTTGLLLAYRYIGGGVVLFYCVVSPRVSSPLALSLSLALLEQLFSSYNKHYVNFPIISLLLY